MSSLIDIDRVKRHLKIDWDDDDDDIKKLVDVAIAAMENFTWRTLKLRERTVTYDTWPPLLFQIPYPPLVSITSITYTLEDGTVKTLDPSEYLVSIATQPGRVKILNAWPNVILQAIDAVTIIYQAGYVTLPDPLVQSALIRIAHYWENRQAVYAGVHSAEEVPLAVRALETPYRIFGW